VSARAILDEPLSVAGGEPVAGSWRGRRGYDSVVQAVSHDVAGRCQPHPFCTSYYWER
jgi:hypothetical protein